MSTVSQHESPESSDKRDAAELAALLPAIPHLVTQLGGRRVTGTWNYQEHRIRIQHRPGAGISALYRMPAGTGFAELGVSTEKIVSPEVASIKIYPNRENVQRPGNKPDATPSSAEYDPTVTVNGWIHPHDPMLPALAIAMDDLKVSKFWGHGEILKQLSTIAYRPLRRAVLRATFISRGPLRIERTIFLKVGRPEAGAALLVRHQLMEHSRVPVPRVLTPEIPNESLPGIVALEQAQGEGLSVVLRRADQSQMTNNAGAQVVNPKLAAPAPEQFITLLDELPETIMDLTPRPAWSDGLHRYARAAILALPQHRQRIRLLQQQIDLLLGSSDRGKLVPTHGDFYVANILLKDGKISALLDLDSLGPGYRVDDLACFLGHLAVLPTIGQKNMSAVSALESYGEVFERTVDPVALWTRSAAVALTLIAGARSAGTQWAFAAEARLQVAEELLARAEHRLPKN